MAATLPPRNKRRHIHFKRLHWEPHPAQSAMALLIGLDGVVSIQALDP